MKKHIVPLLILFASCGCSESEKNYDAFDFSDFVNCKELNGTEFHSGELELPKRIGVAEDKMLLVNFKTPRFVSVYDLKTGLHLGDFLSEGRSGNEVLAVDNFSFDFKKRVFTVNDIYSQKYLVYSFDDFNEPQNILPKRVIKTKELCDNIHLSDDGRIVYIPASLHCDHQIAVADTLGNKLHSFALYPAIGGKRTDAFGYELFMPQIVLNEDENRIAIFSKNSDIVEIYSLDGKLLSSRQGPHRFYPEYRVESENSIRPVWEKARMAYFKPIDRGNKIWVMYNGGLKSERRNSKYIVTFDWNGEPADCFSVEDGLIDFDVDTEHKTIYGLHLTADGENKIVTYKYERL